jgi:predicted amino acid racemase
VFVDVTRRRNPELIDAAAALHRSGRIPSNCYVIDVDTVARNASHIAATAAEHGLTLFQMTKQFGRNPLVAGAVADAGIRDVVAVDFEEARILHAAGLRIGHLGHLVQIPAAEVSRAVDMEPELVTVFGFDQAARIARASAATGRVQRLLLRVVGPDDTFYPGQRGGIPVADLLDVARRIQDLEGAEVAGVTSFPCLLWDAEASVLTPTKNLETVVGSAQMLRNAGLPCDVVNAPSATCSAVLPLLASLGATHVEPGSSLTGQTPLHAYADQPERPAMVYVSEISHVQGDTAYALAGGLYPRSRARTALVYGHLETDPVEVAVRLESPETIDYYGTLDVSRATRRPRVGDSVVYAFRAQVFTSRAFVAVVANVASTPEVLGIFDRNGYRLGADLLASTPKAQQ